VWVLAAALEGDPMARHANDTVPTLHEGAADPKDPLFVPLELRDTFAAIDPTLEGKMRRELYTTRQMMRTVGRRPMVIHPDSNPEELETALVWRKVAWCQSHLAGERATAEQRAYDARFYSCAMCGEVKVPDIGGRGVKARRLATGARASVCGDCFAVADAVALERLGAQRLADGRTRLEAARALVDSATR
jgi:hypothetical protein